METVWSPAERPGSVLGATAGHPSDALTPAQWNWVYAFAALVVVRFFIGGLKMIGFFKELS